MKYVIELEDMPFTCGDPGGEKLYRVKGFDSLVFSETGLSRLEPYDDTRAANADECAAGYCEYCVFSDNSGNEGPCADCVCRNRYVYRFCLKNSDAGFAPGDEVMCFPGRFAKDGWTALVVHVYDHGKQLVLWIPDLGVQRGYFARDFFKTGARCSELSDIVAFARNLGGM